MNTYKIGDQIRWLDYDKAGAINFYVGTIENISGIGTDHECLRVSGKNQVTNEKLRTPLYPSDKTIQLI